MLTAENRATIVDQLWAVPSTRLQLPLLTRTWPDIAVEDAYAIQQAILERRYLAGERLAGYKVGLTSRAMQELAGSTEPDFSALTDTMFLPETSQVRAADYFDPLVEIEIAFVMKSPLAGPGLNAADIVRATDFVLPAIELCDFRVARVPGLTVVDTVADLAACGSVILGGRPVRLETIDVRTIAGSLIRNGVVEQQGLASAVLGNPITSVAWLANKLAAFGVAFEPGQVILSGSFVRAVPVVSGDRVVARFDAPFGDIELEFV